MRRKATGMIPVLSDKIKDLLIKNSTSRSIPFYLIQRSTIILLASQGVANKDIAVEVGLHYNNVAVWRMRFMESVAQLNELEANSPENLAKAIESLLSDKYRSGHPMTFTPEQVTKIIKLACKDPKNYGYEISHWTLNKLAEQAVKEGIADCISAKTVSRFLKEGGIKAA